MNENPFQVWGDPAAPSALFFRETGGFRIRFPNIVDFVVTDQGEVSRFSSDASDERWCGLYEQQVQPLLLSLRGEQVFHGGSVALGQAGIAFLGPSGRGKSTLTAAFARRGHAFLGDDCLHLEVTGPRVRVHPHADFVRLWEDSAKALANGEAEYVDGSPKPRLVAGEGFPHCDLSLPLARIYLLGDGEVDAPVIEPLSPSRQLLAWTANAFVLDIKNPDVLRRNLVAAARLVREVPMRRLDYPRRYELLDDVVDAVLADAAG